MAIFKNITTATTTALSTANAVTSVSKISISNNSANEATVSVYIEEGSNEYYLCKNVKIPTGVALVLDDNISFPNISHTLKITNSGTSPNLSIITK